MAKSDQPEKRGFVFPGQGSQKVGMGLELFNNSSIAREVFTEANDVLGRDLSGSMFNGPEEDLRDTVNSQPAIMTMSVACWRAYQASGGDAELPPDILAGHSLGEYTCLVVGGALPFADTLRLVSRRGELMREASIARPGSMAAIIGLDEFAINDVCRETGVELANDNSDGQVVVSGYVNAVEDAMGFASKRGATLVTRLPVSGAFHCSLMLEAEEGLVEAIGGMHIQDAQIPIVANSTAKPIHKAQDLEAELITGLSKCVKWKASIQYMLETGICSFIELGPGRVLSGLIRRIGRGVDVVSISDPASILKVAGTKR